MGMLRIHCHNCGGHWDLYDGKAGRNAPDSYKHRTYKTCPHCHEQIDGQDWDRQILPAFAAMADANRELYKTHTGYGTPLFSVDYIEDRYCPDDEEGDTLRASIDTLRERIDILADAVITAALMKEGVYD